MHIEQKYLVPDVDALDKALRCAMTAMITGENVRRYRGANSKLEMFANVCEVLQCSANCWRARSRLYQSRLLKVNVHFVAFFKIYKMCTLLHRSKLNILAKNWFENQQFW